MRVPTGGAGSSPARSANQNQNKMADKVNDEKTAMNAAIEKMKKEAGYDVPLAYAALSVIGLNVQKSETMKMPDTQADLSAMADIVLRYKGVLDNQTLSYLISLAVAYGWHYAKNGESMLRSANMLRELEKFIDSDSKILVEKKIEHKKGLVLGCKAVNDACARIMARMTFKKSPKHDNPAD